MDEVMIPTVKGMKAEGKPFKVLHDARKFLWIIQMFSGCFVCWPYDQKWSNQGAQLPLPSTVQLTENQVLEHNVRFGDPECQTV